MSKHTPKRARDGAGEANMKRRFFEDTWHGTGVMCDAGLGVEPTRVATFTCTSERDAALRIFNAHDELVGALRRCLLISKRVESSPACMADELRVTVAAALKRAESN